MTGSSRQGCFLSGATFPISRYYRVYTLCNDVHCTRLVSASMSRERERATLDRGRPTISSPQDQTALVRLGGGSTKGRERGEPPAARGSLIKVSNNGLALVSRHAAKMATAEGTYPRRLTNFTPASSGTRIECGKRARDPVRRSRIARKVAEIPSQSRVILVKRRCGFRRY